MSYPVIRMRRNRKSQWSRDLVAESAISARDFIYPLFVHEGHTPVSIKTLPGILRHSIKSLVDEAKRAQDLGIAAVALFPCTDAALKDETGKEALNPGNLICRAIHEIKSKVPKLGVMVDVALDPYTTHGHDGVLVNGEVDNDSSVEMLVKQSLLLAKCGADILSPSDMMDGRIIAIREELEAEGFHNTQIASYSAKYASCYYSPFRDAVGSKQGKDAICKKTYQLDFRNSQEAMSEIALDVGEGADLVIIKPGTLYLDIVAKAKAQFDIPLLSYHVSGEYAMLKLAASEGIIDCHKALHETYAAFKRAGCSGIISYGAVEYLEGMS